MSAPLGAGGAEVLVITPLGAGGAQSEALVVGQFLEATVLAAAVCGRDAVSQCGPGLPPGADAVSWHNLGPQLGADALLSIFLICILYIYKFDYF